VSVADDCEDRDFGRHGLKYLYITNGLFPIERVDVGVLFGRKLPQRGHRVDIVYQPREPADAQRDEWAGGAAWIAGRVAARGLGSRIANACRRYWNVARALWVTRRAGYDFIQVRDGHLSGLVAWLGAKLHRTRFVYWMSFPIGDAWLHRGRAAGGAASLLYWLRGTASRAILRGLLLPAADHIFVQSERMAADLEEWGVPAHKLTPVPMGVDPESTQPAAVDKPAGERWIGYLGNVGRLRGIERIVDAFARISPAHPDARLILVGSARSADVEALQRRIAALGLEDAVVLTGQRPRAEALGYMQACEICLAPCAPLPFLQSSSPTKLVEYLFLARPVVAAEHPEQRAILDASGAGVCVEHDAQAFADAMHALLEDPQRRAELGARGRDYVLRHRSYDQIADFVDGRYRNLLHP